MAQLNPTISKVSPPRSDGLEIPIIVGTTQENLRKAEEMPEVNMTPNNGTLPKIADAPFANGKDIRSYSSNGPKSNATPAMPGA